jgi:hypothetical protein
LNLQGATFLRTLLGTSGHFHPPLAFFPLCNKRSINSTRHVWIRKKIIRSFLQELIVEEFPVVAQVCALSLSPVVCKGEMGGWCGAVPPKLTSLRKRILPCTVTSLPFLELQL